MQPTDFDSLFAALNDAVSILNRHRTSDPEFVMAMDTLKQAKARIARLSEPAHADTESERDQLVAA